jgi:hypothetical protein
MSGKNSEKSFETFPDHELTPARADTDRNSFISCFWNIAASTPARGG